ncbi:ABC transporter ATP-binding protein/permease [Actinoplanes sp. KI2]|uniref:ABC transporter ATP-binding protein n=1 Tax=Actinoplanes sp. KI2 TaxID=2983315 RepID=UPI0021D5D6E2|nr:ABC transporter ATP-binding protein [Actinoplanes sp. KI2]MCU7731126.1 ABC transporter ATP-binding protein/permease [Actinoplanes sp. KI2]
MSRRSARDTGTAGIDSGGPGVGARNITAAAGRSLHLAVSAAPGHVIGFAIALLVQALVPVGTAWATKLLLDGLSAHQGTARTVTLVVVLLAGLGLLGGVLPQVVTYLQTQLERAVGLRAQDKLYTSLERLVGLGRLETPAFQDRLRLAQHAAGMSSSSTVTDLFTIVAGMVTLGGYLTSLTAISPLLGGLTVVAALPVLAAELAMARRRATTAWSLGPVERREFFYSSLLSSIEAAKEVRLFGAGSFLRWRMLRERRAANIVRQRQDRRELLVQGLLALLSTLVSVGALAWAVARAYDGRYSVGDVALLLAAVVGVQGAVTTLARSVARGHHQLLLFGHYVAVLAEPPDLPTSARPRAVPPLQHGIEFRDVWFRYADDHPWILRGVDLFIPYGRTVGLVGRNGAGKSTLVKLLCRLYDPTRGAIYWDGVDLREFDITRLRDHISTVFQDFMHYDLSAAENIAFGDESALRNRERVIGAARTAGIHDELSVLPRGYDTLLTRLFKSEEERDNPDTGVLLSGGQWQRVALARAFLRAGRDLMILDEPSAGLDALAEHEIHDTVTTQRDGGTAVLISHRLGTLRAADHIVVLADGRIAESGTHDELMLADGRYAELFHTQARGYADQPKPLSAQE